MWSPFHLKGHIHLRSLSSRKLAWSNHLPARIASHHACFLTQTTSASCLATRATA